MRIGYLQVYNEVDWVGYQIDQAMKLCDGLFIIEGAQFSIHKYISERSTDGTLDIISDKIKEYPKRIGVKDTIRKHKGYRVNQCANFNRILGFCSFGDYFIALDADEFYFDSHIKNLNILMKENKADVLGSYGSCFAFGFNWRLISNENKIWGKEHIFKRNPKLYFTPTHNPQNVCPIKVVDKKSFDACHYMWVKPKERMRIRFKTCGKPKALTWFNNNWDTLKLEDSTRYDYFNGYFILKRYDGKHPETLDGHPWLNVEDVREVT